MAYRIIQDTQNDNIEIAHGQSLEELIQIAVEMEGIRLEDLIQTTAEVEGVA